MQQAPFFLLMEGETLMVQQTLTEYAAANRISASTAARWVKEGRLASTKYGKRVLIAAGAKPEEK